MEFLTGYAVFHWIATWATPACDVFFRAATDLGYPTFYYLTIAPLFWIVDRRRACILFLLILASGYINTLAKLWVHTPRPDPQLARVLDFRPYQTGSNAFPSGHAQIGVVFWGYLAWWVGRPWFTGVALLVVLLISFSRLYLAVHFPIDIVGGVFLGTVSLVLLAPVFERWSHSNFRLGAAATGLLVAGALLAAVASTDLTMSLISGSLLGFLAGAVWLPQAPPLLRTARQSWASATLGLSLLLVASLPLQWLPRAPLWVLGQVTLLWIVALWCYPQLMHRVAAPVRERL